jgi:branched-chain amino acid transport system ATP-binding protein
MLEIKNLNASYGDAQVLWDINLSVSPGEIVTVVGPNGAGKTSLVNTIAGILPNRNGYIGIDGTNLIDIAPHEIVHHGVALVPEGRRLFPEMSVQDNLDIGAYSSYARPAYADTLAQVFSLFPRLKERRRQLAGTLSGGEQQMLALGRALMAKPSLLLLDEPSLGLAPVVVERIFEALGEINRAGMSILIVEQNVVRAFELAGRGYILEIGRIVKEGLSEALASDPHVRQSYLGL